jgi:GxxExxY protein
MLLHRALTERIIGAAIAVHVELGAGLLESTYERCLCEELRHVGLRWERQVALPLKYRGVTLEDAYRVDIIVESAVIIEVKAVEQISPIHKAQLLTYLRHSKLRVGLLVNFNVPILTDGIHRVVL